MLQGWWKSPKGIFTLANPPFEAGGCCPRLNGVMETDMRTQRNNRRGIAAA